jgi:hypothetical protein
MEAEVSDNQEKDLHTFGEDQWSKLTILVCRIVCVGLALIEAWSQRQFINEDGISYLDMSDVLIKHNWHLLVNPIWSPLYPFLIGVATWLMRPSAQWEAPVVHALNFVIFLGALASFEFLMRQALRVLRPENRGSDPASGAPLPMWVWQLLGYGFFAWSTIGMIEAPKMITPDLCVAAFVYLDCGLLLRLRASNNKSWICVLLGITLGLGYLAKAVLFPMAFVFMFILLFMYGDWKKAILPLAMAFAVFAAISAPLLVSMSKRVGRLSYSEAGNMNYVWHVNGFDPYLASVSGPPPNLKHPMTILHRDPEVYSFREPTLYTYPPRQDMEYWSAGISSAVSLPDQLRSIRTNLKVLLFDRHIAAMWLFIGAGIILILIGPNARERVKTTLRSWPLFLPGVVAPGLYLLVTLEPRYVAPFLILLLLGLFPGALVENSEVAAKRAVISAMVITTALMAFTAGLVAYHLAGFPRGQDGEQYVQVGQSLNRAGIQPGDDVAIIGDSSDGCRWARMARVRIVAQILREDAHDFLQVSSPSVKAEVYNAFARGGAKAVVAEEAPPSGGFEDWQRLGDTQYYVHFLAPVEQQSSYSH